MIVAEHDCGTSSAAIFKYLCNVLLYQMFIVIVSKLIVI